MASLDVVGKADRRGDLHPAKSRPDQKIDAAVMLMMATHFVRNSRASAALSPTR